MRWALLSWGILAATLPIRAEDKVFSGPQPGEKLGNFKVLGVYDNLAGKEIDFIKEAEGKPTLLIFVHNLTRPGLALTRGLAGWAETRHREGLRCYVVFLHKDRTTAVNYLKTARNSLGLKVPVGVSLDGQEGPGSYGLNRGVELTILVGKDSKVTANFALIQPAMKDSTAIAGAVVKLIAGKSPTLQEIEKFAYPRRSENERDPKLVALLRSIINPRATEEDIKKAAREVEEYVAKDEKLRKQLAEIAKVCVEQKYGTAAAQKQMKIWAEKKP